VSGEITQIGEFSSGDAQVAGFAVTIGLSEAPRDVRDKSVVTVSRVDAGTAVSALAVPLLGVREDERGTFVLAAVDAAGDAGQSRRIDIETGAVSGGYVEVVSGDLAEGDLVVVAGA
jgi:multidrug efflux pump subunit AcrA (membrane-fusion protein)